MIFEEGEPHRTLMSVGEQMIPLFNTLDPLVNAPHIPNTTTNPDHTINDPATSLTPELHLTTRQTNNSDITELQ